LDVVISTVYFDVPIAVRLTFAFVGLGLKLEQCCTVSMTFDREAIKKEFSYL